MFETLISKATALPMLWRAASRRRERRQQLQGGTIGIDGTNYPVDNWSSSGFLAAPCRLGRKVGDRVDIAFSASLPDGQFEFKCEAILVRIDRKNGAVAGVFVMMESEAQVAIAGRFD